MGVGVGAIPLGVGCGVAVCVGVLPGVKVGIKVGGPVTLNCCVAVAGSSVELPAKLAVCEVSSGVAGVSVHDALPLALVVPKQELPSSVICTLAPATGAAGVTEMSLSDATRVTGLPAITAVGLRLSVKELVCRPVDQVITA